MQQIVPAVEVDWLVILARKYLDHRGTDHPGPVDGEFQALALGRLLSVDQDPLEVDIEQAKEDPVLFALRNRARLIGWSLYAAGGTARMRAVLEAATARFPQVEWIIDRWWRGIGLREREVWEV